MRQIVLYLSVTMFFTGLTYAQEHGHTTVTGSSRTVFNNLDCEKTDSCDLKQTWFEVMNYTLEERGDELKYGTGIRAGYITDTISNLERYIFVQLIRGCIYDSYRNALGLNIKTAHKIMLMGKNVKFWFPNWILDSVDRDPAYGTDGAYPSRHYGYRWGEKPDLHYYGLEKPVKPELHVKDFPSQAVVRDGVAENVSLEFMMCLYKTSDVPPDVTAEQFGRATPLACQKWSSSYVYDHEGGKFTSPAGIDPVCSDERMSVISYGISR